MQNTNDRGIAVVGAGGYLGAALSLSLTEDAGDGFSRLGRLLFVSRSDPPPSANGNFVRADVREQACWPEIVTGSDVIFYVAGNTSVEASALDPTASLSSTLQPLGHLIRAARDAARVPRVVYASTARVYGSGLPLPVNEAAAGSTVTPFGAHNRAAEQLLASASAAGTIEAVCLRLGNVYGPSPCGRAVHERNVLSAMTARALCGRDLPMYGDGEYLRDYVFIDDVVGAFVLAGLHPGAAGRTFNVASGRGITVRELFDMVARSAAHVTGKHSRIVSVPWPGDERFSDRSDFVADVDLIASVCGWRPRMPLADGIARLVDHMSALV